MSQGMRCRELSWSSQSAQMAGQTYDYHIYQNVMADDIQALPKRVTDQAGQLHFLKLASCLCFETTPAFALYVASHITAKVHGYVITRASNQIEAWLGGA